MSTQTIKASVLHGAKDLREEDRTIDPPGAGELQVSVKATGICGSDQHYYKHFRNGDIQIREPMSLGHESSGVVVACGPGVTGFEPGDRVALELIGTARLPNEITAAEGALLEPLSVAIHAVRRAALEPGSNVLILGAGPVGLLLAAMLRVQNMGSIAIADVEERRVEFATVNQFADRGVVVPRTGTPSDDTAAKLNNAKQTAELLMDGVEFDAVFECTGVEACVQSAIYSTVPSGKVVIIGMGNPVQTLPLLAASLREVGIVGVFRYTDTYRFGIDVLAKKDEFNLPDITKLVTHKFSGFQNVPQAFAVAARTADDDGNLVLKVIIET
ncbi:hypothetical protein FSARC_8765 [Fusarium sarcochroum]|uniref:Enoyl reductase (ER) domain-containing protein n=1 Tax=Fusarium sarcochroum TaxID=1208366 RepID=A0A8H4TSE2_9HYPO|nr:hypothetical protein FSARC_8765 [Fusarium sarcochroum]